MPHVLPPTFLFLDNVTSGLWVKTAQKRFITDPNQNTLPDYSAGYYDSVTASRIDLFWWYLPVTFNLLGKENV